MNDTEVPAKAVAPPPMYRAVPWLGRHAPAYVPAPLRTLVRHNATPRMGPVHFTTSDIVRLTVCVLCVGAIGLITTWSPIVVFVATALPGLQSLAEWWQIYRHPNRGLMYVPWGGAVLRCPDPANPPVWR